ncbi:hypothetical protein [Cyanobium sp. Copco_Reservoir_LC18]|uniref:hypothetical protein n=1 Tax=Cyanobium sp. Copco_Reservoir_LC18 TaxID=1328305 RepID=UPI001F21E773|nr:hypothetical protein [Cyanobium sp. Copco_Reservoir_LC18]
MKAKQTSPYTPRTNGKAERFIQPQASAKQSTLLEEWACVMPHGTWSASNAL